MIKIVDSSSGSWFNLQSHSLRRIIELYTMGGGRDEICNHVTGEQLRC
jgi:hypothetical protein